MQLCSVRTIDLRGWLQKSDEKYDIGIFACGYETRSVALIQSLDFARFTKLAVLSFAEFKDAPTRSETSTFYDGCEAVQKFPLKGSDDIGVYQALRELTASFQSNVPLRVFVDYSSMSRVWYGAILNYFRHSPRAGRVELNFAYMAGIYGGQVKSNQVESISSVPGFEGVAAGTGKSCAIFALGFDPWCAFAIYERIEPDEAWTLLASRPDMPGYLDRAIKLNEDFIEGYARNRKFVYPTFDLEGVFGKLCELASRELAHSSDVTLVGLGPKPHILSMMLTAIRFPEISLVQARGRTVDPKDVKTDGEGVVAIVEFIPDAA